MSPFAPKHPCGYPGCTTLTDSSRCERHRKQEQKEYDSRRGNGYRWRIASKAFLAQNPLCIKCLKNGRLVAATEVDHIIPHKGNPALFWNKNNWQVMCRRCHSRKPALTDGRWG